jgi:hypothetical protein
MDWMKPLTHTQRLIELIRTLNDAQTTWNPQSGGGGPHLMPSMWNEGSYQELSHQLAHLRDTNPWRQPWWHLSHRYRWGEVKHETVPCRRTRLGPIPRLRPNTELRSVGEVHGHRQAVIVYEWRADIQPHLVNAALDRLLELMHNGEPHRIRLPLDVYCRAAGLAIPEPGLRTNGSRVTLVA